MSIDVAVNDNVAVITLNRPERHNALDRASIIELTRTMLDLAQSPAVESVLLTGAGQSFCSGADLKEIAAAPPSSSEEWGLRVRERLDAVRIWSELPLVTVGVVRGAAAGLGFLLALGSDFIVASTDARFVLPEAEMGVLDPGSARHLRHWLTPHRVRELMLLRRSLSAAEALEWGLVAAVDDITDERALALARTALEVPRQVRLGLADAIEPRSWESTPEVIALTAAKAMQQLG